MQLFFQNSDRIQTWVGDQPTLLLKLTMMFLPSLSLTWRETVAIIFLLAVLWMIHHDPSGSLAPPGWQGWLRKRGLGTSQFHG
jgi:hypothetical protein